MSTSAPIPPHEIVIKYKDNNDGTFKCYDNTGWETIATSKKFAKSICERREITVGIATP